MFLRQRNLFLQQFPNHAIRVVTRQADALHTQLKQSLEAQEERLVMLCKQQAVIDANLESVRNVTTSSALSFQNSLRSDRLVLGVEIKDAEFRAESLRQALAENFFQIV
jgi:hypothetical protein